MKTNKKLLLITASIYIIYLQRKYKVGNKIQVVKIKPVHQL